MINTILSIIITIITGLITSIIVILANEFKKYDRNDENKKDKK